MADTKLNRSKTICPICSLQDGLILQWKRSSPRFTEESRIAVDYDMDNPINEGSLCPRGNAVAELVDHAQRLTCPRVDGKECGWEEALSKAASSLKDVVEKHGPEALGILVGGGLTTDEALSLRKLAHAILGTPNIAPLFPDDGVVFHTLDLLGWDDGFSLEDIQDRQVMILVGDVFMEHPVISKRILRAKYRDRPHRLFVIDSVVSQTAGFAHQHLQPRPGTEALVLAGIVQTLAEAKKKKSGVSFLKLDLKSVAQRTGVSQDQMSAVAAVLSSARDGAIIQSNLYGRLGHAGRCALLGHVLARMASGKFTFLHLPVCWNAQGVYRAIYPRGEGQKSITGPQILEKVMEGSIKGLLLFGLDPLSATPSEKLAPALEKLNLLVVAEVLPTQVTSLAHILLPAAIGPEKGGQVLYLNGHEQQLECAVPPPGLARSEKDIIASLGRQLSPDVDVSVAAQEIEKIFKGSDRLPWTESLKGFMPGLQEQLSRPEDEKSAYPLYLVPAAVPAHLGDGALSRHFRWARRISGSACIWANASLMDKLKLHKGDRVQISSKVSEGIFPLALDTSLPDDIVSAPAHFPEVRKLFSWNLDSQSGELELEPERVLLSQPKESS